MTPPNRPLVLSGTVLGQFVRGGRLNGDGVATSCSLQWDTIGPALTVDGLVKYPIWVSGDIGVAAVRASRDGCGLSDSVPARSTTTISPMFGFSMGFGLTSRVGWAFGGEWVRVPLNDLGIASQSRWSGAGAISIIVAF